VRPTLQDLLQILIVGPLLAAILVAFVLSRKPILARARSAPWFAVIAWLSVGALPWIVLNKVGTFTYAIVDNRWWVGVALHLMVWGITLSLFVCPFLALGATGLWVFARFQHASPRRIKPGGA
jgi:hypothetical protein